MGIFTFLVSVICLMSLFSDATALPVNKEAKKNFESEEFTIDSLEENNTSTDSSVSKKLLNPLPNRESTEKVMNRHKRWMDQSTTTTSQNPAFVYKPWLFAV